MNKRAIFYVLTAIASFLAVFALVPREPESPSASRNTPAVQKEPGAASSIATQGTVAIPDQRPAHASTDKTFFTKRTYKDWLASLTPPEGAIADVLNELEQSTSARNQFLLAGLLSECSLKLRGDQFLKEQGVDTTDARTEECRALGAAQLDSAFARMKAAADLGFAPAQTAIVTMENPEVDERDEAALANWNRVRARYLEQAVRQCSANALILRGMSRLDTQDLHASNQAAYADLLTAELIYQSMFEGAPSLSKLLEQERARLHEHQRNEAQATALAQFHEWCTR